jgi:predicted glycogen debranching enzyme
MLKFSADICRDPDAATSREWLETNGLGGFASSTVSGINTRRYHGLLVAATRPPVGRLVMLAKFEELLKVGDTEYHLSANQYPGSVYPQGFQYLKEFRLDPYPVWIFECGGIKVERSVFMAHGQNATVVRYVMDEPRAGVTLELKPLTAFRDYHHLGGETELDKGLKIARNLVSFTPYPDKPSLYFAHTEAEIESAGHWYRNFEYDVERERGFDFREDLFNPFLFRFDLSDQNEAAVIASTEPQEITNALSYRLTEIARREALIVAAEAKDDLTKQLTLAADQFIVERGAEKSIIAGYHWFSDWGRDTMIALPGLALTTNRLDVAQSILLEFSRHISQGMLPNRFPDAGEEPEYNTVDATLWYFEAIRAFAKKTRDFDFVKENLYEKLVEIIAWHIRGTRYGIQVDAEDGLLKAGERGVQLTWMDAKIGDWVVTPRAGKPVEIQALWYNALRIMEKFAEIFGDESGVFEYRAIADLAESRFTGKFWNDEEECLYDAISDGEVDPAIRPNQIFAVSLPHTMLAPELARKVVQKVESELLTPFGLRSLSPRDKLYRPIYTGDPLSRDSAYHQGTVWGWLIGPFIEAYRKAFGYDDEAAAKIAGWLQGFENHLSDSGIGTFSEIFDAEPPHTPRGCMAQAWSVAEVLRVVKEIRK